MGSRYRRLKRFAERKAVIIADAYQGAVVLFFHRVAYQGKVSPDEIAGKLGAKMVLPGPVFLLLPGVIESGYGYFAARHGYYPGVPVIQGRVDRDHPGRPGFAFVPAPEHNNLAERAHMLNAVSRIHQQKIAVMRPAYGGPAAVSENQIGAGNKHPLIYYVRKFVRYHKSLRFLSASSP
jgi:hypothetical protein